MQGKGVTTMLDKIKLLIEKIEYYFSHKFCYDDMERQGRAVFGMCDGLMGGDINSRYLSYHCMDCPYLILTEKKKK